MLSRVADHLYWVSRYLERAEHTARLIDVHLNLVLDQSNSATGQRRHLLLQSLCVPAPEQTPLDDYRLAELLTFDRSNRNSIVGCISAARDNARQVREQISSEMWEQVNQLFLAVNATQMSTVWAGQPHDFYDSVKKGSHLFQGITDSTMSHGQGWHFIQLGRYLERAVATTRLLDEEFHWLTGQRYLDKSASGQLALVGLLKSCTAFEAYTKVHTADLQPRRVAEFLVLDTAFPHAIGFAIRMVQTSLDAIAENTETHKGARVYRLAGRLRATLDYAQIDEILADGLGAYLENLREQCIHVHEAIYQTFIAYPIEEKLSA
jgi:uncharacterized alpha-E superfamily protein